MSSFIPLSLMLRRLPLRSLHRAVLGCLLLAGSLAPLAHGHGVPIRLSANAERHLLTNFPSYESKFELVANTVLTTTLPGFGIETPDKGIAGGTPLELKVVRELLYWNQQVLPAPGTLTFDNPDGTDFYDVTQTTGPQQGLPLKVYDPRVGWHTHGDYTLEPASAPKGVYGLALQVAAPGFTDTDPFLIAFNHGLPASDFLAGREALEALVRKQLAGDFDRNGALDLADINLLLGDVADQLHTAAFDLTGDARVNQNDIREWTGVLRGTWIGDANLDGLFNSGDLVQVFQFGAYEQPTAAGWAEGDWNGDRRFNSSDFVFAFEFAYQDGGYEQDSRTPVAVPEPDGAIRCVPFAVLALHSLRSKRLRSKRVRTSADQDASDQAARRRTTR